MIQSELKKLIEYVRDQCKMGFKVREDAASRLADAAEAMRKGLGKTTKKEIRRMATKLTADAKWDEVMVGILCDFGGRITLDCRRALAEAERAAGGAK